MKKLSLTLLIVGSLASPAIATGMYQCNSGDRSTWKSIEALKAKMQAEGWKVRRIKEDGGCYEAYGTTPEGQRVEGLFSSCDAGEAFSRS